MLHASLDKATRCRDPTCLATRTTYSPGKSFPLHDHDNAELFWVEFGSGVHLRNGRGREEALHPGSCLLVPPQLIHGFAVRSGSGFVLVNVSFRPVQLQGLRALAPEWPWDDPDDPVLITLNASAMARLAGWLPELHPSVHPLAITAFLLDAIRLASANPDLRLQGLPGAVVEVLTGILAGESIPTGLDAAYLAARVGWSVEHLNRTVRKATGETTTGLLNRLRLEWAKRLLRLDTAPVTAIALRSGFSSLSHFHHLFQAAFGCTPIDHRQLPPAGNLGS